jgi:hypothetical protein
LTNDFELSIRDIDDLLEHLYLKLKGKREGLSLVEPAVILLARLRSANPQFYAPQLARFTPIIMDALISGAYVSFGYEGLESLNDVTGDIALATGDYIPDGVEKGLTDIREEIDSISAILSGDSRATGTSADASGKSETGTGGFFRECAWGTAGLPLVSTYNTGKTPFSTGRVVKARVEIRITGEWSTRTRHDPVINVEHISAEPNSPFEQQIHTAVRVAEKFAAARMGMGGIQKIPREYRISLPEIASFPASAIQRLSGGSAGLAIAALFVSALGRLDLHRYRLRINPVTAFTGTVDETGNILAVEDSHIADKVRGVFFSRFSRLVLPAGNLETAERELAALTRKYPARKLDLVPTSDIAAIYDDAGIMGRRRAPTGKPLLQRMFLWRKHLITSLSVTAAILASLFILPPYFNRSIARIEMVDSLLVIINQYDHNISSLNVGFLTGAGSVFKRFIIEDFNGSEGREAVCVLSESQRFHPYKVNRLHFYSFDDRGSLIRSSTYNEEDIFGESSGIAGHDKTIMMMKPEVFTANQDEEPRLLLLTNHQLHSPAALISYYVDDGRIQSFYHKGALQAIIKGDFDNDGNIDLFIVGYNIELKACVAIVIDPAFANGSSPSGYNYDIGGIDADVAKCYIRLPDFHGYIPSFLPHYPFAPRIRHNPDGISLVVNSKGADVEFMFGDRLECTGTRIVNTEKFRVKSPDEIKEVFYTGQEKDEAALAEGVRYWDGEKWVAEPTVNRSYLEQIGKAADKTVAQIEPVEERLVMKNKWGYQTAAYDAGFRVPKSGAYRKFFFGDFLEAEGDEILCVLNNSRYIDINDPDRNTLFILIFNENGQLLRRHVYHEESIMGSEMERAARNISIQIITSSAPFGEEFGPGYLFVGTHHKMEPPVSLIKFSLDDGSWEIFFHKGFIRKIAARDVDGDGKSELLMTGYNVSLEASVIVVLDPDHIDGSSPRGDCYTLPGREKDIAKYYIRLPFFHRFERYTSRMYPLNVDIIENAGTLRIIVKSRAEEVIYSIEDHMVFTGCEVVEMHNKRKGRPDSISIVSYPGIENDKKELLQGIRFWDGEDWVAEPVVNRSYLRHVKAHNDTLTGKGM